MYFKILFSAKDLRSTEGQYRGILIPNQGLNSQCVLSVPRSSATFGLSPSSLYWNYSVKYIIMDEKIAL